MKPESEQILKALTEALTKEMDPERRARLELHLRRFETLRRLASMGRGAPAPKR
jgi:hypothetical protein